MKTIAIILSAGKGKRMQSDVSKQYININGKEIITYTIEQFEKSNIDDIIIVCGENEKHHMKEIISNNGFNKVSNIIAGGKERYNSVYNALCKIKDADYVLIHDGARPLVSIELINKMIQQVILKKACVPGIISKDTVKISDNDGKIVSTPERRLVWNIQTPQAFEYTKIKKAYDKCIDAMDETVTDDSMVMEKYGILPVYLIEGSYSNIKITTPEDLVFFKETLNNKRQFVE